MKRINWLSAIKGIACLHIFLVHYLASFGTELFGVGRLLAFRPFKVITTGAFSVSIFLQISAFLICEKMNHTDDIKTVGTMCIKRYFRLMIPIGIASVFALLLQNTIGFYNVEVGQAINNPWIRDYYTTPLNIRDLITSVLYGVLWNGNYDFVAPFWMLKTLFIGSYLAIILSMIIRRTSNRYSRYGILVFVLLIYVFLNSEYISIVLGVLWSNIDNDFFRKNRDEIGVFRFIAVLSIVMFFCALVGYCRDVTLMDSLLYLEQNFWNAILSFLMLVCLSYVFSFGDIREDGILARSGSISMGVYLFHWPVICSISSLAYLRLVLQYSDMSIIAHGVHFFVTLMLVLGLAILYNVTFEKGLNRILKNL